MQSTGIGNLRPESYKKTSALSTRTSTPSIAATSEKNGRPKAAVA
jgi:hypothetical protein